MPHAVNALIHDFDPAGVPFFDDEGDQLVGSYYQFIDADDQPVSHMVGPYRDQQAAERAAQHAFNINDF